MSNKGDERTANLAEELAALRADVARLGETLSALSRAQAGAAKEAMGEAGERLSEAAGRAQDSVMGAAADLERQIGKHPLTAVLIAAGLGLALALMTR